jgi:hypothetical protein
LPISFRCCWNVSTRSFRCNPQLSLYNFGHFLALSLEAACVCLFRLKLKHAREKLRNHQVLLLIMLYQDIPLLTKLILVRQSYSAAESWSKSTSFHKPFLRGNVQ